MKKVIIIWLIILTVLIFWIKFVPIIDELYWHLSYSNVDPSTPCGYGLRGITDESQVEMVWCRRVSWDWIRLDTTLSFQCCEHR